MAQPATLPKREDVPAKHTWNAPSVFRSRKIWKDEYNLLMVKIPELSAFKGRLKEGPSVLADYLAAAEAMQKRVMRVAFYAGMSQACNTNDQQANAMAGQGAGLASKFAATVAFDQPELLEIGEETLQGWAMAEPRLTVYSHYINNLFRRQAHVRSAEVEQILGMVGEPFSSMEDIAEMLANADLKFEDAVGKKKDKHTVAQGTIGKLLSESDREVRRSAWENYADSYLAHKNTFAQSYLSSVKRDVFYTRARGYETSVEAALFAQNVPVEVFHNLIKTFRKNVPTWHRYWHIRCKILGVDTLQPYDIWAPLTDKQPVVEYKQSVEWIGKGMKPLGKAYVDALRQGCLKERWVDIYANEGKRQGAFSYGVPGTYPFIMMSYDDDLGGMSTLAHELGHSMHSYLTWKNQPTVYSRYSMFVAEVASNFNQALTRAYLFKNNKDKHFQIALIEEAMSNFHRYFFIMPTLARFEYEVHTRVEQGQGVTADDLIELMSDLFSEGYGDHMHVDKNRVGITWAQFGHLYVQYYTFQYATGISAAHALADGILAGKKGAADNYLKFLSAGSSLYPVDALKLAGVDMSKPTAVEKTFGVLADMVDRLEELTK